jgi:hypothetical protein
MGTHAVQSEIEQVKNKEYVIEKPLGKDHNGLELFDVTVRHTGKFGDVSEFKALLHQADILQLSLEKRFVELGCTEEELILMKRIAHLHYSQGYAEGGDPGD